MHDLRTLIRDAGGSDPRLALASTRALQEEVEWLLVRAVRLARQDGFDWGRIGRLLGVSRQAARQRFQSLAPKVGGPLPPHLAGRTPWEAHVIRINESSADVRRRAEFEGDDPIFW